MQILVFGASGRVGQLVTRQLLDRGYKVKAFVHSKALDIHSDNLLIFKGDINNKDDVKQALLGSSVVISCLGSWGTKSKTTLSVAMRNIINGVATDNQKTLRIISVTGGAAISPDDQPSLIDKLNRFLFKIIAPKILDDSEEHLIILNNSQLNWTVIRSPVMLKSNQVTYKLNTKAPSFFRTISYKSVAIAMVDQISSKDFIKQAPFIHKK